MDDDEFAEWIRRLDEQRRRYEAAAIDDLESVYAASPSQTSVPMPLDWHPAYRDRTWLIDWLNEQGQYADRWDIHLVPPPRRAQWTADLSATYPTEPSQQPIVLTRRPCEGPAPYVGRPFAYRWNASVDEYGRGIAGEARIRYTSPE